MTQALAASPLYRDAADVTRVRAILAENAQREGPLLPVLHAVQAALGHIPPHVIPVIAEGLNIGRAEVQGVVSFYHDFRTVPSGRHVLKLCRAEACKAMGADRLAARVRARLGVDWNGTTADGRVTLEPVYCLGLCAAAPSAKLDRKLVARLTEARVDALLDGVTE